jgi:hypothetical protein
VQNFYAQTIFVLRGYQKMILYSVLVPLHHYIEHWMKHEVNTNRRDKKLDVEPKREAVERIDLTVYLNRLIHLGCLVLHFR